MRLDEPRVTRLLDVLMSDWLPMGNGLMSLHASMVFPHAQTVYFLTRDGVIVYVGQTTDLKIRIAQHTRSPRMALLCWDTVHWFSPGVPSQPDRLQFEAMLICALLPQANRAIMLVKNKQNKLCEVRWNDRSKMAAKIMEAEKASVNI